jgi:hypothetical protein
MWCHRDQPCHQLASCYDRATRQSRVEEADDCRFKVAEAGFRKAVPGGGVEYIRGSIVENGCHGRGRWLEQCGGVPRGSSDGADGGSNALDGSTCVSNRRSGNSPCEVLEQAGRVRYGKSARGSSHGIRHCMVCTSQTSSMSARCIGYHTRRISCVSMRVARVRRVLGVVWWKCCVVERRKAGGRKFSYGDPGGELQSPAMFIGCRD